MEQPIHTFFKYLKEDDTKYLTHDCITRYYEMLRYLMKNNKTFGGKKPIENLYKYTHNYKETFSTSNYTLMDIILFEMKLEVIKHKFILDEPMTKSETKIALHVISDVLDKPQNKLKPQLIIIPSFILSTLTFLFLNQRIK